MMQNRFGLLYTDVMPIFMIISLDIVITLCFSINCSAVICSPTVIISILREASSETYGPRVYFPSYNLLFSSYKFPIYTFSFLFIFLAIFYFPFHKPKIPKILLYRLSSLSDLTLQTTVKGLTTPYRVGCKLVFVCAGIWWLVALSPTGLIPWLSKAEGNAYSTLLHDPFLFKGKPTQCSRGSSHEGGGRALPPWARPLPRGPLVALLCPSYAIWSLSLRKKS